MHVLYLGWKHFAKDYSYSDRRNDVTSVTGMTKISMKNSKCAMSKQKKKDGRPSRYKKHERKKNTRGERARNRARVEK